MKRVSATVLAVIMSCLSVASCQTAPLEETTPSSVPESSVEEDTISIGDHILFGNYPQTSTPGTDTFDPEPIEWRVLDVQDGNALIISEYLLDTTVYYFDIADTTWETSSLRSWLNEKFYDAAFSNNEKECIQTVKNTNPDNPLYGTPGGNDTEDKVFCLSLEEAQLYFKDADDRMAAPTEYAIKQGATVNDSSALENGMNTGWWWLRSPASSSNRAADVDCYGNIDTEINADGVDGDMVFAEGNCVRPVIMISLSDDIKEVGSNDISLAIDLDEIAFIHTLKKKNYN